MEPSRDLREALEARLVELRQDYDAGRKQLALLEERVAGLKETLLRISGAVQVLEDLKQQSATPASNGHPAQP